MTQEDKKTLPELAKEKAARPRQHLKDNRKTYLVGAGCFAAGYLLRQPRVITIVNHTAPAITPVFNNHNIGNVVSTVVNNGGHMHKIVQCLETGEIWTKVTDAAEAAGTSLAYMSRHINGHKPDVFGKHYKIIGLGTTD
jgi:hypothetical protein